MLSSIHSVTLALLLLTIINSVAARFHDCVNCHFYGKLPHGYSFDRREPVACMRHVLKEHQTTSHKYDVELSTFSELTHTFEGYVEGGNLKKLKFPRKQRDGSKTMRGRQFKLKWETCPDGKLEVKMECAGCRPSLQTA